MNFVRGLLGAAFLTVSIATPALAQQDYPNRPITWIVPFAPGGVTDNAARFTAKSLGERLGQPIIVENKPGAGGIVGSEYVANSKPDGYTFLYGSNGPMSTIPATRKNMSYDPVTSFTPLYGMASSPLVMVIAPDKPYKTFQEFVDYARKNPGKLNFASIGTAAAQHLTGELFGMATKTDATHIAYKATPIALADIMSGTIDFMWDFAIVMKPLIDSGKLRALAVSGTKRLPSLPDVPTTAEVGYPQIVFNPWSTVVMPKGVPQPVVDKFVAAFAEVMKEPATIKYYEDTGSSVLPPMTGEKLTEFFKNELAKHKSIIEAAKIPVE
jgi:tripartite-type tricarboxylate transporter receptor subunit TctC